MTPPGVLVPEAFLVAGLRRPGSFLLLLSPARAAKDEGFRWPIL